MGLVTVSRIAYMYLQNSSLQHAAFRKADSIREVYETHIKERKFTFEKGVFHSVFYTKEDFVFAVMQKQ